MAQARLWTSYRQHDFFALRDELPAVRSGDDDQTAFLRAASLSAFAKTMSSVGILTRLLSHPPQSRALEIDARELLMLNRRTLFEYAAALQAIAPLVEHAAAAGDARIAELRNRARLLRTIADVPRQTVSLGAGAPMALDAGGRLGVSVNDRPVRMALDTGANFSVVSRSTARALGLRIRTANYAIGSSMGGSAQADATVVDLGFADGTRVADVIFLVLPDAALKMSNGGAATGLIGFPVIAALGAVAYGPGRTVSFAAPASGDGAAAELALARNDPLLLVSYRHREFPCRLDTGSGRSVFYAPFLQAFGNDFAAARRRFMRVEDATGMHTRAAYGVSALDISLAGRMLRLADATVLKAPLRGVANPDLYCNIGRDILGRFSSYTVDFRRMTLTLGAER